MNLSEFKSEVLPLKDKLFRFACRILQSEDEAKDVVQEIMVRLWESKREYRKVEAFAMTITKNLCLDILKSKRTKTIGFADNEPFMKTHDPHKQHEAKDAADRVRIIISRLPEQQRMVIHLRDIEQYEFEEITEVLGMKLNAVRTNLSRARQKVRTELMKEHDYGFTKN